MAAMAMTQPAFEDAEAALQALRRSPHHPGPVEMLFLISDAVHATLDVEGIAELLPKRLAEEFRAETCAMVLPDEKGDLHVRGATSEAVPMALIRQVIQSRKAVLLPEPTDQTRRPSMAAPLLRGDRSFGALYLDAAAPSWNEHDLALLAAVAAQTAAAVENARLFEQAAINPLSRVYWPLFFRTRLEEEIRLHRDRSAAMGLLLCDVDNLADKNDIYGRPVGDRIIVETAALVKRLVPGAPIGRMPPGNRFAAVLPGLAEDAALSKAKDVRLAVENHEFNANDEPMRCTVSVGVAGVKPGEPVETLLKRVEDALQAAKRSGRNRVEQAR